MAREFKGNIGRSIHESTPAWTPPPEAPENAPNVVFVVLDDVGYGQVGCYGGLCETPNLDRLAARGIRFGNFHTTALCSPTRACLLTGRNHHSNGMGSIVELAMGFPGYSTEIPFENGFLSEMLTPHGYAAYAVGKWHLTPRWEMTMAARKDRWPLGRGFERFYGFLSALTNQWEPELVYDNHFIQPPRTADEGYHLTEDLADHAIEFITDLRNAGPNKPFFLYFCPGACHAPHQVPQAWIDRYRGKFDMGWDKAREIIYKRQQEMHLLPPGTGLTPRPNWIQPWDSLSTDETRLYARMMEVFAAFLSHTDHEIGRLLDFLEAIGELNNTLIVAISDNGASGDAGPRGALNENVLQNNFVEPADEVLARIDEFGSPKAFNHYPYSWAWAGNTPFQRWKNRVHEGGIADPMIVHWPVGIASKGEVRHQYVHTIDIVPTVLDVIGIEPPATIRGAAQSPLHGVSFRDAFDNVDAPSHRKTQYYEMLGNRAIYHDGWKLVTYHGIPGQYWDGETSPNRPFDEDRWELYHVSEDFSECHDLAAQYPEKVRQLESLWWAEAGRYQVLPLSNLGGFVWIWQPWPSAHRKRFVYRRGGAPVEWSAAVNIKNVSHSITARVLVPKDRAEGVLLADGARFGGYSLYVKDGSLCYTYNYCGLERYKIASREQILPGQRELRFDFEKTGAELLGAGGTGRLYVDGRLVAENAIPRTVPFAWGFCGGLRCGRDDHNVSDDYVSPFPFTGEIESVIVELAEDLLPPDAREQLRIELANQ
jgi:arylsulfatase A-like enzyme